LAAFRKPAAIASGEPVFAHASRIFFVWAISDRMPEFTKRAYLAAVARLASAENGG
jgi:hypothetical protein